MPTLLTRRIITEAALRLTAITALKPWAQASGQTPLASPDSPVLGKPLEHVGVNYDVGTRFSPGYTTRPESHRPYLRQELLAIHGDLHCSWVGLFGTDIDRLVEATTVALKTGLNVRLNPRFIQDPNDVMIGKVDELARAIEPLNRQDHEIVLDIGTELALFAQDVIPGRTFEERASWFVGHIDELDAINTRLNALLSSIVEAARSSFSGRLTYASGSWERPDWSLFDIVSVDLYNDARTAPHYLDALAFYRAFGKPVWITEFGCCTYEGAPERGGSGYEIINWETDPPTIDDSYIRSEETQANHVEEMLDLYQDQQVNGAFLYQFIAPDTPHYEEPERDLDMASFAIVKTMPFESEQDYTATGYWEPKLAFTSLSKRLAPT